MAAVFKPNSRHSSEQHDTEEMLRRNQAWLTGQKEAFQAAVKGASLEISLGILTRTTADQIDGSPRCAFYVVGPDGTHLRHVVGMDEGYVNTMGGMRIGTDSLACGLTVAMGQAVITFDVDEEVRWKEWSWLAHRHGFRGCWSFPVETTAGRIVGTFALYFPEPREPTDQDRELTAVMAQSAAVIIAQHQDAVALEAARFALELNDRQKDEFIAMLAHELRNPLAPIGIASELLARISGDDARAKSLTNMIKRQVTQLTRLVDDLLDVSRITQGRIQLREAPVDLAQVVHQAVETVEPLVREKHHRLTMTTAPHESMFVLGDFARLVQCVDNILTNAIKYTDAGGEICVRAGVRDDSVFVEVDDSGAGISRDLLPRVFDLFVQSERTLDRAQGGLGIGLAIVRRLVQMHGGDVCAFSEGLGLGSKFQIRLPRIERPAAPAVAQASGQARARRVLVVDDNADAADSLSLLLGLQGHETHVAYSAKDALQVVDSFRPDVGLLDIGLPEVNGYELARRLRAMPQFDGLRLVALTGYGRSDDRQRALAAGFDDHITKPVDLSMLERVLESVSSGGP